MGEALLFFPLLDVFDDIDDAFCWLPVVCFLPAIALEEDLVLVVELTPTARPPSGAVPAADPLLLLDLLPNADFGDLATVPAVGMTVPADELIGTVLLCVVGLVSDCRGDAAGGDTFFTADEDNSEEFDPVTGVDVDTLTGFGASDGVET